MIDIQSTSSISNSTKYYRKFSANSRWARAQFLSGFLRLNLNYLTARCWRAPPPWVEGHRRIFDIDSILQKIGYKVFFLFVVCCAALIFVFM